jgi:3-methyladenine DNA glycosylase AlkD
MQGTVGKRYGKKTADKLLAKIAKRSYNMCVAEVYDCEYGGSAMPFTSEDLKELDQELKELADEKYQKFHGGLIPNVDTVFYGVRVPLLRKVAKRLIKEDWRGFVELTKDAGVYEWKMLCGMVIGLAKCDFEEKLVYLERFVPGIDNWAVCDIVCGDLKDVKRNKERMYAFIKPFLSSSKEYEVRFAVVILMQYFLTDEYIGEVLSIYDGIRHDGYYVKMAVAWGVSICFIHFREITLDYLLSCNLDDFTYNKSIQKMTESFRVSVEDKEMLRGMKRRKGENR